jgi:hypothetical protein
MRGKHVFPSLHSCGTGAGGLGLGARIDGFARRSRRHELLEIVERVEIGACGNQRR